MIASNLLKRLSYVLKIWLNFSIEKIQMAVLLIDSLVTSLDDFRHLEQVLGISSWNFGAHGGFVPIQ